MPARSGTRPPVKQTSGKRKVGDGTPGPGRPKGSQNKATKALKEMILNALERAGGEDYLKRQATANPTAFLTLVGKVLPSEINASHSGTVTLEALVTSSLNDSGR